MKKLSGLLTLTNVNTNPKCGKMLSSEMNFILTDCWVKQSLLQQTQKHRHWENCLPHSFQVVLSAFLSVWLAPHISNCIEEGNFPSGVTCQFITNNLLSIQDGCLKFNAPAKKKKVLPTNLLTKVLVGAIFMLSSCSNWLEPGATSPYFSSTKKWHVMTSVPCSTVKEALSPFTGCLQTWTTVWY